MAELFFITRGHADHVEKFITSMRSQYFPMKAKKKIVDPETKEELEIETTRMIDGQLRPYQLWGYVLPEEYLEPFCNSLGIPTQETFFDTGENEGGNSFRSGFGVKGYLEALRLMLKAKKLPKPDKTKGFWHVPIYKNHINILGIGWRTDAQIETSLGKHEGI